MVLRLLLGLSVPKKSGNDGFTRSISTSSKHQVGDEKVPYMTVSSLVLEQIFYIAGTRSEFMILCTKLSDILVVHFRSAVSQRPKCK